MEWRSLNAVKYGHAFFKEKFESTNSLSMKPKWSNFKTLSLICTKKTFSFDLNIMHALGAVDIKIYSISAQSFDCCPHLRKHKSLILHCLVTTDWSRHLRGLA